MKTKNLRYIVLSLFAALILAANGVTQVHALTLTCSTNRTVECDVPWTFSPPIATGGACSNVQVQLVSSNSTVISPCLTLWQGIWRATDCFTNSLTCTQTVTVVDTRRPVITCADNKTVRSGTTWSFDRPTAYDVCCGTNLTYSLIASNLVSDSFCETKWAGLWLVSDCCSNYSSICTQLVTVANNPAPYLTFTFLPGAGPLSSGRFRLRWADTCGELSIESRLGIGLGSGGGPGWLPLGSLPKGSWLQANLSNNMVERVFDVDFFLPEGNAATGARFFRLTSDASAKKDFSSLPTGSYTDPPPVNQGDPIPWITFNRIGGGAMEVVSINGLHALQVDHNGIVGLFPPNVPSPNHLSDPPTFHEAELFVVGYLNDGGPTCLFLKAFDVNGHLVDAAMSTNAYSTVTLRSRGYPLERVEVVAEPDELGGIVSIKGRTDYTLAVDLPMDCLDFTLMPTGAVANPWFLPGHTITATNSVGAPETNTFIETHADGLGNGYHVEHSATIELTNNCCSRIVVELVTHSGYVEVTAYDGSGMSLGSKEFTTNGTLWPFEMPHSSAPTCKVVVKAPGGLTRILRICCLPSIPTITLPTFVSGTYANPFETGTGPGTFVFEVSGQLNTYIFQHYSHIVFDLKTETVATFATPCDKVVLEVFSENPNVGMELEAADEFGFVVARAGPLPARPGWPQTVVLSGTGIETVRFKCPNGQGYLKNIYLLPQ